MGIVYIQLPDECCFKCLFRGGPRRVYPRAGHDPSCISVGLGPDNGNSPGFGRVYYPRAVLESHAHVGV